MTCIQQLGDNAQNIVKGIGMKFNNILDSINKQRTCNQSYKQTTAEEIRKNGINLLYKWRQFKSLHKNRQQLKNKLNLNIIRYHQFYNDMQSYFKDIQWESLKINIYNFQEELLKLRQNTLRGADLQFVNQILNNLVNILKEIKNGNFSYELFDEIKLQYQNWKDCINNFEKNEQELLERNRQILKLKWQKVQAGIKSIIYLIVVNNIMQNELKFDINCRRTLR